MINKNNIVPIMLAIIGISLAIYFYNSNKQSKELSFKTSPESYVLYDSEVVRGSEKLSLYINDSIKVDQNVYLRTFSIWNTGTLPISPLDLRKDLEIHLIGADKVLDYEIIKTVDKSVSKFGLEEISNNSFKISWKFCDPGDGIKFQVIYLGKENIRTGIKGKYFNTHFNTIVETPIEYNLLYMGFFTLFITIFLVFLTIRSFKKINKHSNDIKVFWMNRKALSYSYVVMLIVYTGMVILLFLEFWSQFGENITF